MSKSHQHNLGLIVNHHVLWGIEHCWMDVKCYPDKGVTEICDVLGVTQKPIQGLWDTPSGTSYIPAGTTLVGEYKDSKADLRHDESKACRRRDAKAMGDYRIIWLRKDGSVRPEEVDEEGPHYGWGVGVFDQHQARIVREPLRMPNVALREGMRVYGQQLCKDHQVKYASLQSTMQLHKPQPIKTTSAPRSETIRTESGKYIDRHAIAAEKYIGNLPDTTARLLGHLEEETGWVGSPMKLIAHLKKHSKKLVPPPAGGVWTIRGGE